ncbi:helix-turn-helix domain-containing protein, partial [Clostridioides difficile]
MADKKAYKFRLYPNKKQ